MYCIVERDLNRYLQDMEEKLDLEDAKIEWAENELEEALKTEIFAQRILAEGLASKEAMQNYLAEIAVAEDGNIYALIDWEEYFDDLRGDEWTH